MFKIFYTVTFAVLTALTSVSAFADGTHCASYSGDWWIVGYQSWIRHSYKFDTSCTDITEYFENSDRPGNPETIHYQITPNWIFNNRWKAEKDQEWYSLYNWNYWDQNTLITKARLYREKDNQLAWDFTTSATFNEDELIEVDVKEFPIEKHIYKFQNIWTRKGPNHN